MSRTPKEARRGRGRPRSQNREDSSVVTRKAVVELAYQQARTRSLDEITFVQLAKELDVVPGSLHYHLGTKDNLNAAVFNRFYQDLFARLEQIPSDADWREQIRRFAWIFMTALREHRGAAEQFQTQAKYHLFQKIPSDEPDYGAAFLDRVFTMFRDAGFDAGQTAMYYHVLALHCAATANSAISSMEPASHVPLIIERAASYPEGSMPGLEYALPAFARIKAEEAFEFGLESLLDRFAAARALDRK